MTEWLIAGLHRSHLPSLVPLVSRQQSVTLNAPEFYWGSSFPSRAIRSSVYDLKRGLEHETCTWIVWDCIDKERRAEAQKTLYTSNRSLIPLSCTPAGRRKLSKAKAASEGKAISPSAPTPSAVTAQDMPPRHYAFTEVCCILRSNSGQTLLLVRGEQRLVWSIGVHLAWITVTRWCEISVD